MFHYVSLCFTILEPRDAYISELVLGVRLGCPPAVLVAVGDPCDSMGLADLANRWTKHP